MTFEPISRVSTIDSSLLSTDYTDATSITVHGPGALTGKAIKSLGELTLRGLDRIVIYRLVNTASSWFPHTDAQAEKWKDVAKIYEGILELSRPGLYNTRLQTTAMSLILSQIENGQTRWLVQALSRWKTADLEIFLLELILRSSAKKVSSSKAKNQKQPQVTIVQCVILMARIAVSGKAACQVVLNVGFPVIFANLSDEAFSVPDLSDVYRALLSISTKAGRQLHETAAERALQLLVRPVMDCSTSFVNVLALWSAEEIKVFNDSILNAVTPAWYASLLGKESLHSDVGVEPEFVQALLITLRRVSRVSTAAFQAVIKAGYLDLFCLNHDYYGCNIFLHSILRISSLALNILRDGTRIYTENETMRVLELLLSRLSGREDHVAQKIEKWAPVERKEFILSLTAHLSVNIQADSAEGDLSKSRASKSLEILAVMNLLCLLARLDCRPVVLAGYLDLLLYLQQRGFDVKQVNQRFNVPLELLRARPAWCTEAQENAAMDCVIFQICAEGTSCVNHVLGWWTEEDLHQFLGRINISSGDRRSSSPITLYARSSHKTQNTTLTCIRRPSMLAFLRASGLNGESHADTIHYDLDLFSSITSMKAK